MIMELNRINVYRQFQQTESIRHLSLSPDDKLLLGQTTAGDVTVWQLADGKQVAHWPQVTEVPACLGLDAHGYFVVIAKQKEFAIVRLTGGVEDWVWIETAHKVGQLLLHPDGHTLISVKATAWPTKAWYKVPMIQFWDLTRGRCMRRIRTRYLTHSGPVWPEVIVSSSWSDLALLINYDRNDWDRFKLRIYPLIKEKRFGRSHKGYEVGDGYMASVQHLVWSDDGESFTVAMAELSENYIVTYTRNRLPNKGSSSLTFLGVNIDGILGLPKRQQSSKANPPEPTPRALSLSYFDKKKVKKASRFHCDYEMFPTTHIRQLVVTADHLTIAYDKAGQTTVWQRETSLGALPSALDNPSLMRIYDQDRRLVIGNHQGEMRWYALPYLEPTITQQEHQGAICCLVATQNGRFLVSGCTQGRINVWAEE